MGMDVNLYALGKVSDEQLAAASAFVDDHDTGLGYTWPRDHKGFLQRTTSPNDRVEFLTLSRYWSRFYPRGHWPDIYATIRVMQAAFPNLPVYYGSDSSDDGELCTPEFLEQQWQDYLRPTEMVS